MKENVKAALLSALVLPGVGQIYRGRAVKGGILIVLVSIVLLIFVVLAALAVQDILQVVRVSGSVDAVALAENLRTRLPAFLWLGGILFCLWIYGVMDALRDSGPDSGTAREK
jgi:TM2 domain-containing membrane protein YozV